MEPVSAGADAALTIELEIARSYHINSSRPLQAYLIPTSVEFDPSPGVTFDEAIFPEAEVKKLPVSDTPMSVYERTVKITAAMRLDDSYSQKEAILQGRVRSQACDHNSCLPPVWTPFSVIVPVSASTRPPEADLSTPDPVRDENPDPDIAESP
jgi:DsbC/DsbD-like thiol-disulfide interchange protein